MKLVKLLLALCLVPTLTLNTAAQEFKPYPEANITEAQWQSYFDEVRKKHGSTVQDLENQKLLVYTDTDRATFTVYAFTKPGHSAHPAWIARKPEQRGDSIFIGQIGYFVGAEESFAKLFREYLALNDKMKEDIKRQQQQSEKQSGSLEPTFDRPQQKISSSNPDTAWRPSAAQQELVETASRSYFAARDGGKTEAAYAFLSERQKQLLTYSAFQKLLEESYSKTGAVQGRHLQSLTWYKDTPQAGPGLYVAVDFAGTFANLALHCGYVVWQEQTNGHFLLVREEVNMIDNATMEKMTPGDIEKVRAQFRC
ncbi:MAG: DUF4019 domain-containing protein [Burkholderiaceae bacterium]